jgi:hypothetical protein
MEQQPWKELEYYREAQNSLSLEVSQLVKLQLVEKLVFTDLPVSPIPTAVDYHRNYHVLHVYSLSDVLLDTSRVFG